MELIPAVLGDYHVALDNTRKAITEFTPIRHKMILSIASSGQIEFTEQDSAEYIRKNDALRDCQEQLRTAENNLLNWYWANIGWGQDREFDTLMGEALRENNTEKRNTVFIEALAFALKRIQSLTGAA